jgi:hypothetical protein
VKAFNESEIHRDTLRQVGDVGNDLSGCGAAFQDDSGDEAEASMQPQSLPEIFERSRREFSGIKNEVALDRHSFFASSLSQVGNPIGRSLSKTD